MSARHSRTNVGFGTKSALLGSSHSGTPSPPDPGGPCMMSTDAVPALSGGRNTVLLCSRAACMPPAPDVALVACIPHQARVWLDELRQPAGRTLGDARCGGKHIHRRARQPEGALQAVLDLPAAAPQLSARPSPARNARACELAQAQRATQPCRRQWLCTCTGRRARCAFGPRRRLAARPRARPGRAPHGTARR